MTRLSSFTPGLHAVVIGASGGIGAAFADLLDADPQIGRVTRLSRASGFDLTDPASITDAAAALVSPPDLVIVATGLLHAEGFAPERDLRQLSADAFARAFAVNAIGPALVAQAFLPLLPKGRKTVFAALSARVGSISDNRLGGWHAYRASKAALNMIIRNFAVELARTHKQAIAVTLHPGTVDSALSEPFQRNVEPDKLFTPDYSAERLLSVLDGLTPADSGHLFAWDGQRVDF